MRRAIALSLLLVVAGLGACKKEDGGPGGNVPGNFARGAYVLALPFLPTVEGEVLTLGLSNLSNATAPVTITAYQPNGTPYPAGADVVNLPPRGSTRLPLTRFTGFGITLGGWLQVDTRNLGAMDPVTGEPTAYPSSGLVVATLVRQDAGIDTDACGGIAPRDDRVEVTVNHSTRSVQLINMSYLPMAGGATLSAASFDYVIYDAFGDVYDTGTINVAAQGSVQVDTGLLELGLIQFVPTVGGAQTAPAGSVFQFCTATLEDDPQVMIESRYLEPTETTAAQYDVGFDLEFGVDEDGNIHDFGVYLGNPTDSALTVQLSSIRSANGGSLLPGPRLVTLDAHATKYMATTTLDSRGLDTGEDSVFQDIFGNVDLATGLSVFSVRFSLPRATNISARDFDSRFKSYRRILPGYRQTTDVVIPSMDVSTFTTTGTRNYATFSNPQSGSLVINIRGYTPGGTEYILGPVTIGPFSRFEWSPDGTVFREDPTDTQGPPVPYMMFLYSASGGMFFNGRRWRVDAAGLIEYQRPFVVRNLRAD